MLKNMVNLNRMPRLRRALLRAAIGVDQLRYNQARDLARPRVQIMMLHEVSARGQDLFRRMLDHLGKYHRFISYSDAIEKIVSGRMDAPYLAFTFDDGLNNNLVAARILAERHISGCFFVCPAIIEATDHAAMERFRREQLRDREATGVLSWREIETLLKDGHEIGGHTATHANLAESHGPALVHETFGCYETLRQKIGPTPHFCWPFGRFRHMNPEAVRAVFDAGFTTCASAERGCHTVAAGTARQLCVRRDQVDQDWPLSHVEWFLARNSRRAGPASNRWPEEWIAAPELAGTV